MKQLTDYERQFADQHHDVVYRFLRARGLNISEYYDVVIFRYLGAVQQYLSRPSLQEYSFDTIACNAMRSALGHHYEAEKRKQEFCITDTNLVESLVGYTPDERQNDVSKLLWMEVAALLSEPELKLVNQRANGMTYREIAEDCGLKEGTVSNHMGKLRKRIISVCDIDAMLVKIIG